ncbi:UNVERIFIED_CONTAM: Polyadenylate-binding protein RBP47C' [Sesamum calycinum]|uniref:Polyadenylate-binding protein RBP47C n=1 Tax=Sesamum calycinum TaxID=2727403 RepID=A0AAW2QNR2_9LAMI
MQTNNGSESQQSSSKDNNNNNNESGNANNKVVAPPQVVAAVPGQQWVAMQYPMVMQHGMMPAPHYAPHYMPYHHHLHHHPPLPPPPPPQQQQQQTGATNGGGSNGENRTIWVGDLHNWMDEDYLRSCFASTGEVSSIKVIRNKQTGFSEGYGFVEFFTHAAAEKVLQSYSCLAMPNTDQLFRDLAADVTDTLLHETFASKYPSVKAAKVVIDANTGRSKRLRFRGYSNGVSAQGSQADGDSVNTTVDFVGGLDPNVTDEDLRQPFSQYGEIVSVKIPVGKGCGFVQFANRNDAEEALQHLSGTTIGKQTSRTDYGNQWTGAYYGGPFFDGYGYAMPPPHDPSMYAAAAAAYGAYPVYGTHQQQPGIWSYSY